MPQLVTTVGSLDVQIASVDRDIERLAKFRATLILQKHLQAMTASLQRDLRWDAIDSELQGGSKSDPTRADADGLNQTPAAPQQWSEISKFTGAIRVDRVKLGEVMVKWGNEHKRVTNLMVELIEAAHPAGVAPSEIDERILSTTCLTPSVFSKCKSKLRASNLVDYDESRRIWFVNGGH